MHNISYKTSSIKSHLRARLEPVMPKEDLAGDPKYSFSQHQRSLRPDPDQVDPRASDEAVAGSIIHAVCENQHNNSLKPILDVPNDTSYSMRRWLQEPYRTSPWWLIPSAQRDGK